MAGVGVGEGGVIYSRDGETWPDCPGALAHHHPGITDPLLHFLVDSDEPQNSSRKAELSREIYHLFISRYLLGVYHVFGIGHIMVGKAIPALSEPACLLSLNKPMTYHSQSSEEGRGPVRSEDQLLPIKSKVLSLAVKDFSPSLFTSFALPTCYPYSLPCPHSHCSLKCDPNGPFVKSLLLTFRLNSKAISTGKVFQTLLGGIRCSFLVAASNVVPVTACGRH